MKRRLSLVHPFVCTLVALVLAPGAACSRAAAPFNISLATDASGRSLVRVTGLSGPELTAIEAAPFDTAAWQDVLAVRVAGASAAAPLVAGRYRIRANVVEFAPLFPFDAGRQYDVTFDPSRLPVSRAGAVVVRATVGLPAVERTPSTRVARMLPTADVLPENLLRVYLEFSAPMSRESGRDFVTLFDENNREVPDAFLSLDVEFWSFDYRRYTLLFDPGRVKRGILPNDTVGRALRAGHRYTIRVDPRWRDGNGQPLAAAFERSFTVGPPDLAPMTMADWQMQVPAAGTRTPLVVSFPRPLDHGLLQRTLGVLASDGELVAGAVGVGALERTWVFTPRMSWTPGAYRLFVLSSLEDPAGNRLGRPFDIDRFDRIDRSGQPEQFTRAFEIK